MCILTASGDHPFDVEKQRRDKYALPRRTWFLKHFLPSTLLSRYHRCLHIFILAALCARQSLVSTQLLHASVAVTLNRTARGMSAFARSLPPLRLSKSCVVTLVPPLSVAALKRQLRCSRWREIWI